MLLLIILIGDNIEMDINYYSHEVNYMGFLFCFLLFSFVFLPAFQLIRSRRVLEDFYEVLENLI